MSAKPVDLPDDCWELIIRLLDLHRHYESLSLVCKQLLSITKQLQFSLTISEPTILFLPQLFVRFPRLKSIDLSNFHGDLGGVLHQIARSGLELDSLNISNQRTFPVDGLRELGSKMRNLRILCCSKMRFLHDGDLLVIADCFPFLQELDISFPENGPKFSSAALNDTRNYYGGLIADARKFAALIRLKNVRNFAGPLYDLGIMALAMVLRSLRKINLSGNYFITDVSLLFLCKNCELLREIALFDCSFITQVGIASAIRHRPNLISITVNNIGNERINGIPNINSDFIGSLMTLKSLTAIDLSNSSISDELLRSVAAEGLPLTKLILSECRNYTYAGIHCLLSKCQSVQYLDLQKAAFLSDQIVRELSLFLPNLTFINLSHSLELTDSTFVTLTRNCPLLNEIKMERTFLGVEGPKDCLIDFVVNSQVKILHLAQNSRLSDESIKRLTSICPNLQLLDLRSCWVISEEGVVEVLKRCCKIRHLSLAFCAGLRLFEIDFEVSHLEVLKLSETRIGDEALSIISKNCRGLTHLEIQNCFNVTAKGVTQVVENCRGLREINLKCCNKVAVDIVAWMVFSRPSLRKIIAPPGFDLSESQKNLFLRHGCLVC